MTHYKQALVFAAGLGTRLRPLTETIPKPLLAIDAHGTNCLGLVLEYLHAENFDRIIVNAFYLPDAIQHFVHTHYPNVIVSVETEPLETGGGFIHALPYINEAEPILVINGDTYLDDMSFNAALLTHFSTKTCDIMLGVAPKEKGIAFKGAGDYDFVTINGEHLSDKQFVNLPLNYRPNSISAPYTFIGSRITTAQYMRECAQLFGKHFSFKKCFDHAEASNRLYGCLYTTNWCDLSTVHTLEALRKYNEIQEVTTCYKT